MTNAHEHDPIRSDARVAKRRRQFPAGTACCICGETDLDCLVTPRSIIESHHVLGSASDDAMRAPLCQNCHHRVTAGQWDSGVFDDLPDATVLHRAARMIDSLASMLTAVVDGLRRITELFRALIVGLDRDSPGWRSIPEMRAA